MTHQLFTSCTGPETRRSLAHVIELKVFREWPSMPAHLRQDILSEYRADRRKHGRDLIDARLTATDKVRWYSVGRLGTWLGVWETKK